MNMRKLVVIIYSLVLLFAGCDDLEDKPYTTGEANGVVEDYGTAEMYILNEGLFNLNNSTLARYSFLTNSCSYDYFRALNHRGLGDTANDMDIYGSKLYVVVNVSSTVEVIDLQSGLSVKQIPMLTDNGSSRQPRAITFDSGKAYVCSYDGTVVRIDTASLEIDGVAEVGRNPEDLCVQDGKLYVSNSGGLDWAGVGVDRTVSVVDLSAFAETKKIEVGPNPGKILAGPNHSVWVATQGEQIEQGDYKLVKINSQADVVEKVYDEPVMDFAFDYNIAYLYNYDYSTGQTAFKVFDLTSGTVLRSQFITDGTNIERPFSIQVNPYSSNVYITEAYNYQVDGDLLCFTPEGTLMFRLSGVGLNPNTVLFRDEAAGVDTPDNPDESDEMAAYADKVFDYVPAPTQYMNTVTTAYTEGFTTKQQVLDYAAERLRKKSLLSLGAYGGYIVLGFSQPVPNVPGEYDFKIYGNANYNPNAWQDRPGGSAEPGIVLVSKDENGNGLPDDEWYELAGSEYGKTGERRNLKMVYTRPDNVTPSDGMVEWVSYAINESETGTYCYAKAPWGTFSVWPAWLMESAEGTALTYTGCTMLPPLAKAPEDLTNGWPTQASRWYDYGYVCNSDPTDETGSSFDIGWARDKEGNKVNLPGIDFVKIQNATLQDLGYGYGPACVLFNCAIDLHLAGKEIETIAQ